jgi:hypothetical protein
MLFFHLQRGIYEHDLTAAAGCMEYRGGLKGNRNWNAETVQPGGGDGDRLMGIEKIHYPLCLNSYINTYMYKHFIGDNCVTQTDL